MAATLPNLSSARPFGNEGAAQAPLRSEIEALQFSHNLRWIVPGFVVLVTLGALLVTNRFEDWVCGTVVLAACVVPIYLWTDRYVIGAPIWPIVAFLSFLVYGLPFIANHPLTEIYSFEEKLTAAATIALVVSIITAMWAAIARGREPTMVVGRIIIPGKGTSLLLASLAIALLFQLNSTFTLVGIPSELFGTLRAILSSFATVAVFSMSYELARRRLTRAQSIWFVALFLLYVLANTLTLYLYVAMQIALIGLLGYFLGGGRPPWKAVALLAVAFMILQAGKSTPRAYYWSDDGAAAIGLADAPRILAEWIDVGIQNLASPQESESQSLVERGSLMQMVLKVQTESPSTVPFLDGETYAAIPALFIPRFVWPERPTFQETVRQLTVHYGVQTYEQSETTSIAWGLVAESYANFGYFGCLGLAIAMGLAVGLVQRFCGRFPLTSARGLLTLLVMSSLANLEAGSAALLTSFVQSLVGLVLLALVAMGKQRLVG